MIDDFSNKIKATEIVSQSGDPTRHLTILSGPKKRTTGHSEHRFSDVKNPQSRNSRLHSIAAGRPRLPHVVLPGGQVSTFVLPSHTADDSAGLIEKQKQVAKQIHVS